MNSKAPKTLLKNRDIVIVGQQPWDTAIGSNCKNIAMSFAEHNRVLYVNSPLDRITLLKHKADPKVQKRIAVLNKQEEGLISIGSNLWNLYPDVLIESIVWLKFRALFNFLNRRNNQLFASSIARAVAKLGFKDIILFNDNDIFRCFYLVDLLKPKTSIYYSRDYMIGVDYWKYHGSILEPKLIAKNDICVANSTYLAKYCAQYNKRSYYVGQGCDLSIFTTDEGRPNPTDIAPIKRPIIGYVGALQSIRLDIELLVHIATNKPEWSIVLVGPEDDAFKASKLHQLSNVYFLGSKSPDQLPAYIQSFDVCINPQIVNEITIGNYPRKIDEYLAMGKPVVATNTEAMSIFAPYTYLANGGAEYLEAIAAALANDRPALQAERAAFAATHTWENNVAAIYDAINSFENKSTTITKEL